MPIAKQLENVETIRAKFADLDPPYSENEAIVEASRCLYCFDAPCTRACPTHIDVPKFIRQIFHDDPIGAAETILTANIFGGSCARACPTEVLCEGACVDNTLLKEPVRIGRLQRHACDAADDKGIRFFEPGPSTGKRVAVVGAGPAGLSCAHALRRLGHDVTVFEARDTPGGLNTFGIAAYKITTEFALSEVELVRQVVSDIRLNHPLDAAGLEKVMQDYDAVFLGVGLGRTAPLKIAGEDLPGVWESLDFIEQTHTRPLEECEVGQTVMVIGAGNTAIDVATAARRLGAKRVIIAYRRTEAAMPAYAYEFDLALTDGVNFEWLVRPTKIVEANGRACGVEFQKTRLSNETDRKSKVDPVPGSEFVVPADMIVKALGQQPLEALLGGIEGLERGTDGRVLIDSKTGRTSRPKIFAGGDCTSKGAEIVNAVEEGKTAAKGIHAMLTNG